MFQAIFQLLWNYDIFIDVNGFSRLFSIGLAYCGNCLYVLGATLVVMFFSHVFVTRGR